MVVQKKHRNVLYTLVIILAIIQIVSFVVLTSQISRLNVKIETQIEQSSVDLRNFTTDLVETYDSLYQKNFQEISDIILKQQQDFKQEIKLVKSSQEDFSGIVEDAVKSVVTVATERSIGSGFIVHPSGFIVTNYHVISDNRGRISVRTFDKGTLPAELIGKDELRDLALLKIQGEYEALELAEDDDLQVGKKVIAIGNPLGLSFTVTEGIISALDRVGPSGFNEYVQTDVSLNPGNSGGPLIDIQGKVIGINNFKIDGAESLGFSLESAAIRKKINEIANQTIIS